MNITKKQKVLFLVTKGGWGGAQRYVFDLATSLPKEEYEAVVACGEQGRTTMGEALPEKLSAAEVRCARLPHLDRDVGLADIAAIREIFQLLKKERPNILHLNSSKAALLGALAMRLIQPPTKIIFTVHGWPFNEPRGAFWRFGIYLASWLTALLSHAVIVICDADLRAARRLPFIRKKVFLIPNGITPFETLPQGAARSALAPPVGGASTGVLPQDTAIIVTIAELTRNKGLSYALRAVARLMRERDLPMFRYIIVGEGEGRAQLERIIAEEKLSEVARIAGFIPDAQSLLSGADIFLLPSLKEGLPYVLLEAGATGVPTVATNVGGVQDIIGDMQNGMLIRPKREKEIADALRFLLRERKRREAFGAALREKVLRDFSFEKMLSKTIAVYK